MSEGIENELMVLGEQGLEILQQDEYQSTSRQTYYSPEQALALVENIADIAGSVSGLAHAGTHSAMTIASCVAEAVLIAKEMDNNLAQILAEKQESLERFRAKIPAIERTIDRHADTIDRLLDRIIAMPTDNQSEQSLRMRSELIAILMKRSDDLQNMILKFIAS